MSNEKVVVDIIEQEILELSEQALNILLKGAAPKTRQRLSAFSNLLVPVIPVGISDVLRGQVPVSS